MLPAGARPAGALSADWPGPGVFELGVFELGVFELGVFELVMGRPR
jgi:hypothetical protein